MAQLRKLITIVTVRQRQSLASQTLTYAIEHYSSLRKIISSVIREKK